MEDIHLSDSILLVSVFRISYVQWLFCHYVDHFNVIHIIYLSGTLCLSYSKKTMALRCTEIFVVTGVHHCGLLTNEMPLVNAS